MKKLQNRGQGALATAVGSTAIILVITVIVLGTLFTSAGTIATTTRATAAIGNVTNYTWIAVGLVSVGLVIIGGFGLLGLMGKQR